MRLEAHGVVGSFIAKKCREVDDLNIALGVEEFLDFIADFACRIVENHQLLIVDLENGEEKSERGRVVLGGFVDFLWRRFDCVSSESNAVLKWITVMSCHDSFKVGDGSAVGNQSVEFFEFLIHRFQSFFDQFQSLNFHCCQLIRDSVNHRLLTADPFLGDF